MDFHAAMETYAEAWVAANTQTAVTDGQVLHQKEVEIEDLPTQLPRDQLLVTKTPTKPPSSTPQLSPSACSTRSLPIHCVIEQTSGTPSFDSSCSDKASSTSVELDSYAILPGTTLLSECVRAALIKLGYNSSEAMGAKGAIQVKNWKPLCFDIITDNKTATIDDILGELTQVATLRIRICSTSKVSTADDVKEKLLQLLLSQSQQILTNAGCPIDKGLQASLTNGHTLANISPEMRRAFDRWYEEQLKSYAETNGTGPGNGSLASAAKEILSMQQERTSLAMASMQRGLIDIQEKTKLSLSDPSLPMTRPVASSTPTSTPTDAIPSTHPALQHYLPGKTRMRTSFDPEHEIPRLQRWFAEAQHPTRETMLQYLSELNSLESRKGRRPLDLTNIIYWFKNARAAHRRAQAKSSEEDSFEMEEEREMGQTSLSDSLPFLPNRNAVYMVPYPFGPLNGQFGPGNLPNMPNGHFAPHNLPNLPNGRYSCPVDDKEPCDLSINGRSSLSLPKSSSPPRPGNELESPKQQQETKTEEKVDIIGLDGDADLVKLKQEGVDGREPEVEDGYTEIKDDSSEKSLSQQMTVIKVPENVVKSEHNSDIEQPKDLSKDKLNNETDIHEDTRNGRDSNDDMPDDLSVNKDSEKRSDLSYDMPKDLTNGKRALESDDDFESDYDDNRSIDGSISSHDDSKLTHLHESYLSAARGLNFNPATSSPSGQPLHIPQFPHPLAMHYFPLNTHLYSQQANQMKYQNHHPSQQTPTKPTQGQGQENNSHRKRRTRVFIDPLSEIPKLEKWFLDDTHPSSYMIDKFCEELNSSEYRQKFPRLEPKNVQLWFKNHRAKVKRMRLGGVNEHIMFD